MNKKIILISIMIIVLCLSSVSAHTQNCKTTLISYDDLFKNNDPYCIQTTIDSKPVDIYIPDKYYKNLTEQLNNGKTANISYYENNDGNLIICKINSIHKDTTQTDNDQTYVASANSDKFHTPGCKWAKKINEENKITFNSKQEAESNGYKPCNVCHP
ncbi:Ada metal-binding domain-containing protein [uncultured Methanobrevibacter sp.]|uniref:Ada metal-binding domain-containing protein n=1 Tax=uncultured Methanobrevibacter sp. TaxID=253161 RepID=UPI0026334895|nr:Ada metal-binding domain-containing protein [uncultured Methanobrevibacter sp.]